MGEPHARCHQEELALGEGWRRETHGNLERMGHVGETMMPALETPRLSLKLLKWLYSHCICSPKTGITLLNNQRGYVHSEPPIFIRTVVVGGVHIAARRQRFRAASLLPRMMSANDGPGGEPTRRSAVPSPSPPDRDDVPVPLSFGIAPPMATAVVGGRHRSLVIVLLSRTVAVIFLVLLLPPERMPIPDRETRPRRATYERRSQMVKLVRGGQHTTTTAARRRSTRAGSRRRRPGGEDDTRRSIPFLRRPLGSIGGAIRTTYDARSKSRRPSSPPLLLSLFDFFPAGIAMIVRPRCRRSDSPHPQPIPIPTRGTPRPPRSRISPRPFRGGPRTRPRPHRASRRRPHRRRRRRHRHHLRRRRDSHLDVVLARRSTHHARPCRRRRNRGGGGGTLRIPECPFPPWAVAGASAGVVASSPPPPVLAARADNDDDEDGRIIVEETREKTRRGRQQGSHLVHYGHVRQYVHHYGLGATAQP
jgi:hypothetical protein